MKEWFSEAQIRAIKVNKMTIVIRDQSTSMTQSIGESFGCALVLCYLALMIKEEFQISYGDIFLTAAFEDLRGLDDYIICLV